MQLPGLKIPQNYFRFSIGGVDLVLGIQWLASLNLVQANWNKMFLIFNLNGQKDKLQGVPHKAQSKATFQYLPKRLTIHVLIISSIQKFTPCFTYLSLFFSNLILYHHLGHTAIPYHSSQIPKPPNIRPYRYPNFQKSEIENQVSDLLRSSFIRPQFQPFCSFSQEKG